MNPPPNTTRIDFERQGNHVLVQFWQRGWQEGQMTDRCDFLVNARILHECEKSGFTVEMADGNHGRALRGEITRVDIVKTETGWKIEKWPFGWSAKTRAISSRAIDEAEATKAIAWLKAEGWTLRQWPNGTRAFKGEAKPVRDAATIRYLRNQANRNHAIGHVDERRNYDLAFDF
jgi:hypothetical protein